MKPYRFLIPVVLAVFLCLPLYAAEDMTSGAHSDSAHTDMSKPAQTDGAHMDHNSDTKMEGMDHEHKDPTKAELAKIGVDEQLGKQVALDAVFKNSKGETVSLKDLINKPTIIAPVYFGCPNVCNFLQAKLADIIPQVTLKPGQDYQVISLSFDDRDTPEVAAEKKVNYMKAADGKVPDDAWVFLTGDQENIKKFTESIGFKFLKRGMDFAHPVTVVAVSPSGKIVRYLYGTDILPFELTMAAVEAAKEHTGLTVKKLVSLCFSYDPQGKKYVFNIMRVSGAVVLAVLLIFAGFLFFGGKKRK